MAWTTTEPMERDQLAGLTRAAFGARRRLGGLTRLRGGSKKGVYRAAFDDGFTAIIYIWADAENYWPASPGDPADPFSAASGLDLFLAAQARLAGLGVRTPRLYLADPGHLHYPADAAVLEDIPGPTLEALLRDAPRQGEPVLERLGAAVQVMHACPGPGFGKIALIDRGGIASGESCAQVVLGRALVHLAEACAREPRIAEVGERLGELLRGRAAAVRPRSDYRLIHGELGPDHVLIDDRGDPVIIDIEGLMYFDAEWEHVFLRLRFGQHYRALQRPDLDQDRLACYTLATHLSLVAGPLRLLDGAFPDREPMRQIAEHHIRRLLDLAD